MQAQSPVQKRSASSATRPQPKWHNTNCSSEISGTEDNESESSSGEEDRSNSNGDTLSGLKLSPILNLLKDVLKKELNKSLETKLSESIIPLLKSISRLLGNETKIKATDSEIDNLRKTKTVTQNKMYKAGKRKLGTKKEIAKHRAQTTRKQIGSPWDIGRSMRESPTTHEKVYEALSTSQGVSASGSRGCLSLALGVSVSGSRGCLPLGPGCVYWGVHLWNQRQTPPKHPPLQTPG